MDPDVGCLLLVDNFDLAVRPVVLAVGALEDEATARREAPLEGRFRLLLRDMIGVTLRQVVEVVQIVSPPYPLRVMKAKSVAPAFADNSSQFSLKSGRLACSSAAAATAAQ